MSNTDLLVHYHVELNFCYVYEAFKNNCQVNVIFMQFARVFDNVNHNVLVNILKPSGIDEPLLP